MDVHDVRSGPKYNRPCLSLTARCLVQNVQKRMLGKEWLAKVDNETSTPYLLVGSVSFVSRTSNQLLLIL